MSKKVLSYENAVAEVTLKVIKKNLYSIKYLIVLKNWNICYLTM